MRRSRKSIIMLALATASTAAFSFGIKDYQIRCPAGDYLVLGCGYPGGKIALCSSSAVSLRDLRYSAGRDLDSPEFQYPKPGEAPIGSSNQVVDGKGVEWHFVFHRERIRFELTALIDERRGPRASVSSRRQGEQAGHMTCRAVEFNPLKE